MNVRWLRISLSLAVAVAILVAFVVIPNDDSAPQKGSFCVYEAPPPVDFTVINDALGYIANGDEAQQGGNARGSVFFDGTVGAEAMYYGVIEAIFGVEGVPPSAIPAWVHEYVQEQLAHDLEIEEQLVAALKSGEDAPETSGVVWTDTSGVQRHMDASFIQDVFDRLVREPGFDHFSKTGEQERIFEAAINGLINGLGNRFAQYTPASEFSIETASLDGVYVGFGYTTDFEDGKITISSIFRGQPAALTGLRSGDVILAIDGLSTNGCSQSSFGQNVRGPEGTTAVYTIRRSDHGARQGLVLQYGASGLYVSNVFPGSPAEAAGIVSGDTVLAIGGQEISEMTERNAMLTLGGFQGTELVLTVRSEGATREVVVTRGSTGEAEFDLAVTRGSVKRLEVISWPAVNLGSGRGSSADELPFIPPIRDRDGNVVDEIIYIGFRSFTEQSLIDLVEVARHLRALPPERRVGLIFDIRGNGGGIYGGIVAGLFFKENLPYMLVNERGKEPTPNFIFAEVSLFGDTPMVVLAGPDPYDRQDSSDNCYSNCEAFSGAVQAHDRALVISESITGGKGVGNANFALRGGDYGGLRTAIFFYTTPDGTRVHGEDLDGDGAIDIGGIEPDILVIWTDEDHRLHNRDVNWDPTLFEAIDQLRAAISG